MNPLERSSKNPCIYAHTNLQWSNNFTLLITSKESSFVIGITTICFIMLTSKISLSFLMKDGSICLGS
jgi:hypothetical protein